MTICAYLFPIHGAWSIYDKTQDSDIVTLRIYVCVHCGQEDQLQVDNEYFPQCHECQNVNRVKRPAKYTNVRMYVLYAQEYVYVAFILDMMIVFNK